MFSTFAIYDKSFIVVVVFFFMPSHSQDLMWELMNGCSEEILRIFQLSVCTSLLNAMLEECRGYYLYIFDL